MATQAAEVRSDRLVVLLSKAEKATLQARARASNMTVSDYVRAATERFELDEEMPEDLGTEIVRQLDMIKDRMRTTFDNLDAYLATRREPDPQAVRARVFAELGELDIDWDEVRRMLGLDA